MFMEPQRFEPKHISFVMKEKITSLKLIIGCIVHVLMVCLCDTFNLVGNPWVRVCREFADQNE